MRMLRCRKCGAAVISEDTLIQSVLDQWAAARQKVEGAKGKRYTMATQEAAEWKQVYKSLMHNISNKDYAESVTPFILHEFVAVIRANGWMTDAEIDATYMRGKQAAQVRREQAEREIRRIYGGLEYAPPLPHKDPTANKAISRVDRERRNKCQENI